jgi:hypothetical protein
MKITSEIDNINKMLNDYNGDQAKVWLFDISHAKMAIRIYSQQKNKLLYLVVAGCKYMKGPFSLFYPKLSVNQYFDNTVSEMVFKIVDRNSDFELSATSGIALAEGLESEFGDSFEDFLKKE